MNIPSLTSLTTRFKAGLNKWRLIFLVFALIYAVFLLLDLTKMSIQWDEVIHLNGGSFLLRGEFKKFTELNSFYPPLFDAVTMGFFKVLGVSVLSGRLVSVAFSLLSLWMVFELAYRLFDGKTALVSSVLLGVMPGYFWLSRVAMIETMLIFFFTVSMLFFFSWLCNRQNKMLVLSGLALGLGFLTKYQMLIAGVIMIASILLLARGHLKLRFSKFTLLIITVVAVAIPWILISYQTYASKMIDQWIYALQVGNPEKSLYSIRYPIPIFYFIEMTWPYSDVHPISLLLYGVGLLGLGLFAWRRKKEDKFLLIWFAIVFVFFTLIANKHWRYVLPLFPVLAISAAGLIWFVYGKAGNAWRGQISVNKKRAVKVAAGLFTVFLAVGVVYSANDAYHWVAKDQIQIDIEGATNYAASRMSQNDSIMLLFPFNLFSQDMARFYLWADGTKHNQVSQYPELPVDTYAPSFNITEFIALCEQNNVKIILMYSHGADIPFFNTTLKPVDAMIQLGDSGRFIESSVKYFGSEPHRIYMLDFIPKQDLT